MLEKMYSTGWSSARFIANLSNFVNILEFNHCASLVAQGSQNEIGEKAPAEANWRTGQATVAQDWWYACKVTIETPNPNCLPAIRTSNRENSHHGLGNNRINGSLPYQRPRVWIRLIYGNVAWDQHWPWLPKCLAPQRRRICGKYAYTDVEVLTRYWLSFFSAEMRTSIVSSHVFKEPHYEFW